MLLWQSLFMGTITRNEDDVPVIRITEDGLVYMRTDRGAMVQVSLTEKEIERLRGCTVESRITVLAAIIARVARPH